MGTPESKLVGGTEKVDPHKEYGALEPVPKGARNLGFGDMIATWIGANANNGTWYVGGVVAGAGVVGSVAAMLIANPIAYLIMILVGYIGFKIGTSTMALTRPSFGLRGSYLPSIMNVIQFIGWTAVNTYIAAISISIMCHQILGWPMNGQPGGNKTMMFGIVVMSVLHLLSIATGHRSVKIVERIGVVLVIILALWETIVVFHNLSFSSVISWHPPKGKTLPFGIALDQMAAFSLAWTPAIAEFTRYAKNRKSSTVAPMIGANIGLMWFCSVGIIGAIGTAITTGIYDPNNSDPSMIATKLGLGWVALLVIVISSTTTNAICLMSAGISLTNVTKKLNPIVSLWAVTIVAAVLTVVPLYVGSFVESFMAFLEFLGMVFGPILAIVIIDFYLVRKRNYNVEMFGVRGGEYWYTAGFNLRALITWVIGVVFFLTVHNLPLFVNTTGATYPSILVSGIVYYAICKLTSKSTATMNEVELRL